MVYGEFRGNDTRLTAWLAVSRVSPDLGRGTGTARNDSGRRAPQNRRPAGRGWKRISYFTVTVTSIGVVVIESSA